MKIRTKNLFAQQNWICGQNGVVTFVQVWLKKKPALHISLVPSFETHFALQISLQKWKKAHIMPSTWWCENLKTVICKEEGFFSTHDGARKKSALYHGFIYYAEAAASAAASYTFKCLPLRGTDAKIAYAFARGKCAWRKKTMGKMYR